MALARHARPLPLASLTRDLLLRRAQELFHDELRRSGRATGCGGYGTLFPFVGPPRCVCTLCEYSPAAVGGGSCRSDVAWQSQPGASMSLGMELPDRRRRAARRPAGRVRGPDARGPATSLYSFECAAGQRPVSQPRHITLSRARSWLDRSRFLQPRPHFAAFFEIYKKLIFSRANFAKFLQNFNKTWQKFCQNLQNFEKV